MKIFTNYKKIGASVLGLAMIAGISAQEMSTFTPYEPLQKSPDKIFPQAFRDVPSFVDFNNDGFLDIYYSGQQLYNVEPLESLGWNPHVTFMINKGEGVLENLTYQHRDAQGEAPLPNPIGLPFSALSNSIFFDYNNDGYVDAIIQSGSEWGVTGFCQLYKNLGPEFGYKYELVLEASFRGDGEGNEKRTFRSIAVGDLDNDGYADVGIIGFHGGDGERFVELYRNNEGDGTFSLLQFDAKLKENVYIKEDHIEDYQGLHPLSKGSIAFGDLDNDGYLDVVVSGYMDGSPEGVEPKQDGGERIKIYRNTQNGAFEEITPANHGANAYEGDLILADFNNDGFLDILISGYGEGDRVTSLLVNDTQGSFETSDFQSLGLAYPGAGGALAAADLNNDGRVDFISTGWANGDKFPESDSKVTKIYYQRSNGQFRFDDSHPIVNCNDGSLNFGDLNNDNTLDVMILGYSRNNGDIDTGATIAVSYTNEAPAENKAPDAPTNFKAEYTDGKVVLSWDAANDDITPTETLVYNVFLRNTKTNEIYSMIPADLTTGRLRTTASVQTGTRALTYSMTRTIATEDLADYEVGVQAIDQSFAGSLFVTAKLDGFDSIEEGTVVTTKIENSKEGVTVISDVAATVTVTDLLGKIVAVGTTNNLITLADNGIYVVSANGVVEKIIR